MMGLQEGQRVTEQRGPSREELENRMDTAGHGSDAYAVVPVVENNDLLAKTYQSFKLQQEGMSQNEADNFQKMQSQQRETQYMATNPQLIMKSGKFDD